MEQHESIYRWEFSITLYYLRQILLHLTVLLYDSCYVSCFTLQLCQVSLETSKISLFVLNRMNIRKSASHKEIDTLMSVR